MELFARPEWLWGLLAVPGLALWVARGRRRRLRDWQALGQSGRPRGDGAWGWVVAAALLVVALAQPRWGFRGGPGLPPGHDVVLLVDVSRSMAAQDAVPSRLAVAKEAAESLVAALGRSEGSRAAVVAFAGRGSLRCPLTENLGAVAAALRALRPGGVEPGGTNLAAALESALDAFDEEDHTEGRSIVVFSDGEDHPGTWAQLLPALQEAGVVIHSVAIGDAERAHPVPSGVDSVPLTYRGEPVASKRSDAAFEALGQATGGAVVRLGLASADLGALYAQRIAPVAKRQHDRVRPTNRVERYPAFVLGALAAGFAGAWPRRRRWWRRPRAVGAFGLLLVLAGLAAAPAPGTAASAVAAGQQAYAQGHFAAALEAFEQAIALDPQAAIPRYDAGAALFQLGRYAEALDRYREARTRAEPGLRTKVDYALGNASLAVGNIPAALGYYDACLASRVPGAAYDAVRRDAAINRRFAQQQALNRPAPGESERPPQSPEPRPSPPSTDRGPQTRPGASGSGNPPEPGKGPPEGPPPGAGERGPGGAGGSGETSAPPGSPEARLASAMNNIREAQRRRLPDEPPPAAPDVDLKDW